MWWSIVIQSKQWLCGFLKFAFWRFSEGIRVAESFVSSGTHRWVVAFHFLFTRLSLYFKPQSYFSTDEMKCLEGLVSRYFAGFSRVSMHDTERVAIFFFSRCSCVEQEIMRRPLTVRAAATDKQEKNWSGVVPVRWNTVAVVSGTWLADCFRVTAITDRNFADCFVSSFFFSPHTDVLYEFLSRRQQGERKWMR